jgi:hypothetical protein
MKYNLEKASKGLLDFHTHSTCSDGGDSPAELVKRAKIQGVSAIALTDHNVINGLEEFNYECSKEGIFSIPFGTEIHIELPKGIPQGDDNEAPDMIILGKNPKRLERFVEYQNIVRDYRVNTFVPRTFERLREMGFNVPEITNEELRDINDLRVFYKFISLEENLGKLVNYIQNVDKKATEEEIRAKPKSWLNKYVFAVNMPGYTNRLKGFKLEDALGLVEDINCKLFIAHPGGEYGFLSDSVLDYLIKNGIHGIGTRSYFNTQKQNEKFDKLAGKYNLICSGGSDCHGDKGPFKIGIYDRPNNQIPKEVLKELWESLPE